MALDLEKIDLGSFGVSNEESDPTQPTRQLPVEAVEERPRSLIDSSSFDSSKLRSSLYEATKQNPDQYAEKMKLSRQSGIPSFAVEGAEKDITSKMNFDNIDLESLNQSSPGTAKFLSTFDNAAMAHDDVSALQRIEQIITSTTPVLSAVKNVNKENLKSTGQGLLHSGGKVAKGAVGVLSANLKAIGLGTNRPDQELLSIYEGIARGDSLLDRPSKEFLYEPIDSVREMMFGLRDPETQQRIIEEMQIASGDSAQSKAIRKALFNSEDPIEREQLQAALDQVQGAALNSTLYEMGSNLDAWIEENIYKNPELENAEGFQGFFANDVATGLGSVISFMATAMLTRGAATKVAPGMSAAESAFVGAAIPGAGSNYAIQFDEALNDGATLEEAFDVAGISKYIGTAEGVPIMDFLGRIDRASGGTIGTAIKNMLIHGTEEAIQEGSTEIANAITRHATYDASGGFSDTLGEAGHSGAVGFTVGALLEFLGQAIVPGRKRGGMQREIEELEREAEELAKRSDKEQEQIDYLDGEVQGINLKKRSKESFEQFMQDAQSDGEKNIFINGEQVAEYLRDKTPEEINEDPALRMLAEQSEEAAALKGDVVLPLDKFASNLSGTEHYDALRPHMKMSPDTLTPDDRETAKASFSERTQRLVDEASQNVSQYVEAQEIYETVKSQLIDTGRIAPQKAAEFAKLIPAWATVHAARNGISVREAYQRSGLRIEGPMTGRKAAIEAGKVQPDPAEVERRITDVPATDRRQADTAPVEDVREGDRRQDTSRRSRIEEMSPEDQYKAIYTNELTGLNNRRAFEEDLENSPVVASVDVDSLKAVNDNLGHAAGDELLVTVGKALHEATGGRAYHISGDEFYVLGENATDVGAALEKAREALQASTVETEKGKLQGVGLTYGVADSKEAADQAMEAGKTAREETGERVARGELPAGLTINSKPFYQNDMSRTLGMYSTLLKTVLSMKLPQWKMDKNKKKSINAQITKLTEEEESLQQKLREDDKEFQKGLNELQERPGVTPKELNEYLNQHASVEEEQKLKAIRQQIRALRSQLEEGPATKGKVIWEKLSSEPVKADELKWVGIEEFLTSDPEAKFTRDDVATFINQNGVNVVEVVADQEQSEDEISDDISDWSSEVDDDSGNWEGFAENLMLDIERADSYSELEDDATWVDIDTVEEKINSTLAMEMETDSPALPDGVVEIVEKLDKLDAISAEQLELPYIEARDIDAEKLELRDQLFTLMKDQNDVDEFLREAAEEHAREMYFEEPYMIHTNEESGYQIVGNDDIGYSIIDNRGRRVEDTELYSLNEAVIQANGHARDNGVYDGAIDQDDVEVARWGDESYNNDIIPYTNYRELKLTLPDIPGHFNHADHEFPDDNIVAFLRVTDREVHNDDVANGGTEQTTFFIEELQSDWHQLGRKHGYGPQSVDYQETTNLELAFREQMQEESVPEAAIGKLISQAKSMDEVDYIDFVEFTLPEASPELKAKILSAGLALGRAQSRLMTAIERNNNNVPDAPFSDEAWIALGVKRAIIAAIEQGYTTLAWNDANSVANTWSTRYLELYQKEYDEKIPSIVKKLTKQQPLHLNFDGETAGFSFVFNDDFDSREALESQIEGDTMLVDGYGGLKSGLEIVEVASGSWNLSDSRESDPGYWILNITPELRDEVMNEGFPLFQGAKGYYDPANSLIRLTESSDLTTFIHETAHFMYEMELKSGSPLIKEVNEWYKRNVGMVTAEANSYLGTDSSVMEQSKQAAEAAGFDTSQVFYHGSQAANIEAFTPGRAGTTFFSVDEGYSKQYGENVYPVYLKLKNTADLIDNPEHRQIIIDSFNEQGGWAEFNEDVMEDRDNPNYDPALDDIWEISDYVMDVLQEKGFDSVRQSEDVGDNAYLVVGVFDPANIRSVNAVFDPAQAGSSNLLAQGQDTTGADGPITEKNVTDYLEYQTTGDAEIDAAIRRALHEHFARAFEEYVMEGKAPSIELQSAFRKIASWMIQAYKAIFGGLRTVNLDDQMRSVFDRLLATEEQIEIAQARSRFEPLFTDAAVAGMTEREYEEYQARQQTVKDKANETLRDKAIKQFTRAAQDWWKEEKKDVVATEKIRIREQEPVYRARDVLRGDDLKLDHATIIEQYGKTQVDRRDRKSVVIPPALRGMTAKGQEGVHPDQAAAFLGYDSGAELINDLINKPKLNEAADVSAEAIMVERHGDIFTDGTIEQLADEAVNNDEKGRLILQELRALTRGTNQGAIDRATLENLAEENIGKLSFRQIHPGKYRTAEIRAAQEAAVELSNGNREAAARAKTQQALNFYLGKAATKARDDIMGVVDWSGRYRKKAIREAITKAGNGYMDQIDRILGRFDLRKSATMKGVDERNQDINSWLKERVEDDGDTLDIHPAVLNELYTTHWKNVPVADLRGIRDSVKNIEHVAKYSNKIRIGEEEINFQNLVDDWTAHIRKQPVRHPKVASDADKPGKAKEYARWSMAQMSKIPWMASWLDGGERVGMSYQVLVDKFETAYAEEIELIKTHARPVMEAILNRSKEDIQRHNTKIYVPEIKGKANHTGNLMGSDVLIFALNTGNPSNLRKMLLGEQFADPDDDSTISFDNPTLQAVLKHMTESDWILVQNIWDGMNGLYPMMAEVYRQASGKAPPKVEAEPVVTPFGTFAGGYYPMKYDTERSERADRNEERQKAQVDSMFTSFGGLGAETTTGAVNERTGFYDPIRLSLDVVPNHFQEVIHYITHYDAVRQTNKILRNHKVKSAIKETIGKQEYDQLIPWLRDIARDGQESSQKVWWEKAFRKLRFGATVGIMGFKATTGIIQISGLSNSASEIGSANLMQGMRAVLGDPDGMKGAWEFAKANSRIMEHRVRSMDREILTAMRHIDKKKGLLAKAQEVSMMHIAYIQTYMVDLPTWHGAYIKGMKEWGDEQRAFQYADWVIQSVQGSGLTKDLPAMMRNQNESVRLLTMFMTFFSSLWNKSRDLGRNIRAGKNSPAEVAAQLMFMYTIPVLFEMIMRGELFDEDDEPEEQLQHFLTNLALFPIATIPFVRDIASASVGSFGYNLSPVTQLLTKGIPAIKEVAIRTFSDDDITRSQLKNATRLIGASLGVPGVYQMWATYEHLYEVLEEGEDFTTREVLFGPKYEE